MNYQYQFFAIYMPNGKLWGLRYSEHEAQHCCSTAEGYTYKELVTRDALEQLTTENQRLQGMIDKAIDASAGVKHSRERKLLNMLAALDVHVVAETPS